MVSVLKTNVQTLSTTVRLISDFTHLLLRCVCGLETILTSHHFLKPPSLTPTLTQVATTANNLRGFFKIIYSRAGPQVGIGTLAPDTKVKQAIFNYKLPFLRGSLSSGFEPGVNRRLWFVKRSPGFKHLHKWIGTPVWPVPKTFWAFLWLPLWTELDVKPYKKIPRF